MQRAVWLLLAATACGTAGCASHPPRASIRELPTELPMLWRGTEPAVEVFVDGQGPFLFAIDTGGSDCARADASLVERLGLRKTGLDLANDASGSNVRLLDTVKFATLSVGGIDFHDVEAMTRDYNHDPALPHIDGILTFDLFAEFLLTLDYPAQRVRIERGDLPEPDGAEILPLLRVAGLPAVEVTFAGQRTRAEIDSGNLLSGFFLPASLVAQLPLAEPRTARGEARTVSHVVAVEEATLDGSVLLGRYEFQRPRVAFPTPFDFANIGGPALRDFAVTFDQRNERVRFVRRAGSAGAAVQR